MLVPEFAENLKKPGTRNFTNFLIKDKVYHRHCVSSKNKTGVHEETWEQKYNFDTVFVWKIYYTY